MELSKEDLERIIEQLKEVRNVESDKETENAYCESETESYYIKVWNWLVCAKDSLIGMLHNAKTWIGRQIKIARESKNLDFVVNTIFVLGLAFLSYYLPKLSLKISPDFDTYLSADITICSYATFKFFICRLVIDTTLYINEYKFFQFIKRNGNNAFDYQEEFQNDLTPWQRQIITTIKYVSYMLLWVFLVFISTPLAN